MIEVALPDLQPGWTGGVRYLSTIREGVGALEQLGIVRVVNRPRFCFEMSNHRMKYGLMNAMTYSADAVRGIGALNLPRPLGILSKKSLAWIPDLQDVERPEFFERKELHRREQIRRTYMNRSRALFFSSSHALEVFNSIGYSEPLIAGILRFATVFQNYEEENLGEVHCYGCQEHGFFYLPNQWWIHKNHKWALESFLEYQNSGGRSHLVLTGTEKDSRWPDYSADQILSQLSVKNVHRMGMVERSLQKQLYTKAKAIIQPSSYEGWSTTIEEALSLGAPVIASNIPTNTEQLFECRDSLLVINNSRSHLVEALHSPPKKIGINELTDRSSLRWKRFLNDLEKVITIGNKLVEDHLKL